MRLALSFIVRRRDHVVETAHLTARGETLGSRPLPCPCSCASAGLCSARSGDWFGSGSSSPPRSPSPPSSRRRCSCSSAPQAAAGHPPAAAAHRTARQGLVRLGRNKSSPLPEHVGDLGHLNKRAREVAANGFEGTGKSFAPGRDRAASRRVVDNSWCQTVLLPWRCARLGRALGRPRR